MSAEVSTRRQLTRDRLMAAAMVLFAERSVQAASVEEICERAGFTRGAFYSNFESKEELCLEIVRQRGEQLVLTTQEALAAIPEAGLTQNTLDEVLAKILVLFDAGFSLDEHWVLIRGELRLYSYRMPGFRPALLEVERRATELALAAISETLTRQGATLRIPLAELMPVMDAYCERARMNEILTGSPIGGWRQGLEHLLRALVVLPA
ncbi:TetR/AcrR family transcriptional regulator [Propionicimonas sp.]|uniref:TetR/AcrR family transcriptional regulator n=1 Tax=Propionicimonas sp. TaxID=1955623 RepID=UPI0017CB8D18|nr:TetR/AcrR family transcriptional regulator [Propionicimonas sp.]MBU3975824.1 TetR/AcrR family transcriptional regulator [Actinomycetota bacterium]MBA3022187.1 TetR/AcrR family transcriptional regulator [Propionicimonas sp.]MBU3987374.1 TetR/AcrR family transcriptional regulator [Actinomycetota bacterium]MBU4006407.1 TetR/AcrR family transcriptional regulator [Actinomycetota bacterium]MBU4065286.1 TetR/AcrR family transcriptional regulator [Actinomycetota bacterium]